MQDWGCEILLVCLQVHIGKIRVVFVNHSGDGFWMTGTERLKRKLLNWDLVSLSGIHHSFPGPQKAAENTPLLHPWQAVGLGEKPGCRHDSHSSAVYDRGAGQLSAFWFDLCFLEPHTYFSPKHSRNPKASYRKERGVSRKACRMFCGWPGMWILPGVMGSYQRWLNSCGMVSTWKLSSEEMWDQEEAHWLQNWKLSAI